MTNRNEAVLPAATQLEAGGTAVAASSRLDRAIGVTVDPARKRWLFALLLVAGWLVQAGLRAWFSRTQVLPLDNPDETAYLIEARVLAGGPAGNFSGATMYQGGYPLLITPVYWFTSNPTAVYHAVLLINAAVSAAVMPLGYLLCRRLGLGRLAAYGVAMVAALLPAGFFYSEYAISDAIFPVVTLAWLLATHSWLVAASPRARYAAAVGSAAVSGYAYAVHSRGEVLLAGFVVVGVCLAWRRPAARGSAATAALTAVVTAGAGWALDRYLVHALYPQGAHSLSGSLVSTLTSSYGAIHVSEMAGGQLWRLVLDSWGIAGIGLVAAVAVAVRGGLGASPLTGTGRGSLGGSPPLAGTGRGGLGSSPPAGTAGRGGRTDLRVMAALSVGVTVLIACAAPAALGPHQALTWVSGRYLDGMIVTFFLIGAVVLLRAAPRLILASAAGVVGLTLIAAVTVAVYAGKFLPTGPGRVFPYGVLAVLTQNWSQASVLLATAAGLALLLFWVLLALIVRRMPELTWLLGIAAAAVSLVAVAQLTAHCSVADSARAKAAGMRQMAVADGLKPGEQIAITSNVSGILRLVQGFEVTSTQVQPFNSFCKPPPAHVTVIDAGWPARQPAASSWPAAPASWRIVAANRVGGWVVWRRSSGTAAPGLMGVGQCTNPLALVSLAGLFASGQT